MKQSTRVIAQKSKPWTGHRILLAALLVAAFVTSLPSILDVVGDAGSRAEATRTAGAGTACHVCGVVEDVREIGPAVPKHSISTVAGGGVEGIAVLLGALSGKMTIQPSTTYEVEVLMRDGSVRVLQSKTPLNLKPGDQVKVRKGAIEGV